MKSVYDIIIKNFSFLLISSFMPIFPIDGSYDFGITKDFCNYHFNGVIAFKGDNFNKTDVINSKLPNRRIVAEFVTSSQAYIWYEHGGRGYHQHLVQYHPAFPEKIINNYSFFETKHKDIWNLINDSEFLKSHRLDRNEL